MEEGQRRDHVEKGRNAAPSERVRPRRGSACIGKGKLQGWIWQRKGLTHFRAGTLRCSPRSRSGAPRRLSAVASMVRDPERVPEASPEAESTLQAEAAAMGKSLGAGDAQIVALEWHAVHRS